MSTDETVIAYQSERELWYVYRGKVTAVISAEDMINEYYRWRYAGAPGVWRDRATAFCHQRLDQAAKKPVRRPVYREPDLRA